LGAVGPIQAAEDGSGITYLSTVPTEAEPPAYGEVSGVDQVLSERGAAGWSTRDIATPHNSAAHFIDLPEYTLFTGDLSSAIAEPETADRTLLSSEASEPTPYIRREAACDTPASAGECFLPLLTGKEGVADVPPGTTFGPLAISSPQVISQGVSSDLRHVVLNSDVALTATPVPNGELYEWSADVPASEALQLVSVLPASEGGGPAARSAGVKIGVPPGLGNRYAGSRHAVSDDGSRVFWQLGIGALYMRDTVKRETVRLDVKQPGAPGGGTPEAAFQTATPDGSKVFFNDGQRLTSDSGAGKKHPDLYECDIVEQAGKLACRLTDLTPERSGHSAEVRNMLPGASEDGSYVYFVANGVLSENKNSEGESARQGTCPSGSPPQEEPDRTCNLYEYHDGTTTFIATVSMVDESDWGSAKEDTQNVGRLTAYASPDGRYLTFMSVRSLTGYDNRDAASGKPDAEVYVYDALGGHLACVSCDPTGARPIGFEANETTEFAKTRTHVGNVASIYINGDGIGAHSWIAANLPAGPQLLSLGGEGVYQPRVVSDGGRVFFDSLDALVPQDVNNNEDVYEFEPQGTGSCTASSVTFNPKSGGCASLVSSGTSPEESGFLDASKSGNDVFFLTSSRLTSQDSDTSLDVYDAHVCTALVPCVTPGVSVPPCDSGDACKGAPAPQPAVFGTPASATFNGAGNVLASPSGPGVRSRSLTRAQKLARALKACGSKPKRKRRVCERQARRRYAVRQARRDVGSMRKVQG
jgi:hypothetical protein